MKTRNNVQKVAVKITAVIASIVLIGLNVNAQGLFGEFMSNDKYEKIGFAYVPNSDTSGDSETNSNLSTEYFVVDTEDAMEVEEWMLNETYFNWMVEYSVNEIEESLELEDWMTNEKYFGNQYHETKEMYQDEMEIGLEMESWMVDDIIWEL